MYQRRAQQCLSIERQRPIRCKYCKHSARNCDENSEEGRISRQRVQQRTHRLLQIRKSVRREEARHRSPQRRRRRQNQEEQIDDISCRPHDAAHGVPDHCPHPQRVEVPGSVQTERRDGELGETDAFALHDVQRTYQTDRAKQSTASANSGSPMAMTATGKDAHTYTPTHENSCT